MTQFRLTNCKIHGNWRHTSALRIAGKQSEEVCRASVKPSDCCVPDVFNPLSRGIFPCVFRPFSMCWSAFNMNSLCVTHIESFFPKHHYRTLTGAFYCNELRTTGTPFNKQNIYKVYNDYGSTAVSILRVKLFVIVKRMHNHCCSLI